MLLQNNDLSVLIIYILIFFTNFGPYIENLISENNINNFLNIIQKILKFFLFVLKWGSYGTKLLATNMMFSGNFFLKKLITGIVFISRNKQKIKDLGKMIKEKEIFNFRKFLFFRGFLDKIDQQLLEIEEEILMSKEKNYVDLLNEELDIQNLETKETTNHKNSSENSQKPNTSLRSKTRYSKEVYFILNDWYKTNGHSKFTKDVKQKLAEQTNLTIDQISNWMKNKKRSIKHCNNYSIYNKDYFNETCNKIY